MGEISDKIRKAFVEQEIGISGQNLYLNEPELRLIDRATCISQKTGKPLKINLPSEYVAFAQKFFQSYMGFLGNKMVNKTNLEILAGYCANFVNSEKVPNSADTFIKGPRPFCYLWTKDGGMEILTFKDSAQPETAKLFRYSTRQLYSGVDLEKDTPVVSGKDIVKLLVDRAYVPYEK